MPNDGGVVVPAGLPLVGALVGGKYRLERYIAEGGMGIIAVARHVELDEPIALKFLKPEVVTSDSSGMVAGRFVREARATIKIRSEHVPRILDVTTLETGVPYIVMELLVGEDLDKMVERQGPLPIAFAVDVVLQALEALAAAHALGMVHRDLKPANLFMSQRLDGSPCVKVLDFGIAKLVDRNGSGVDQGLTGTSAVMGSPRYMAPEQMRSTRDVDARADVWAIGTTLFELLTGQAPFEGDNLTQLCAAILQDDPRPMHRWRGDVPAGLEAIVVRCLAKRPDDRPANVAELAALLAPFGTAPTAFDAAARAARVLGSPVGAVSSTSAFSVTGPLLAATNARAVPKGASGLGGTHTAWGESTSAGVRRRRVWTITSVSALLVVAGGVLGGVALFGGRGPRANAIVGTTSSSVAAASSGAPPPAVTFNEVVPVARSSSSGTEAKLPVSSSSHSATPPVTNDKPRTKPNAEPKAPPTSKPTATAATKPSGPSHAEDLWNDRK